MSNESVNPTIGATDPSFGWGICKVRHRRPCGSGFLRRLRVTSGALCGVPTFARFRFCAAAIDVAAVRIASRLAAHRRKPVRSARTFRPGGRTPPDSLRFAVDFSPDTGT
jgi:hypothetical protein